MSTSPREMRIAEALTSVHSVLEQEAAKLCPHAAVADGALGALLSILAEVCLTPQEQAQVQAIQDLHYQCHYPSSS